MDTMSNASEDVESDDEVVLGKRACPDTEYSVDNPYDQEFGHNVYSSYQTGKEHFEKKLKYAQIKDKNGYFHQQHNGDFTLETESGMQQMFRNLYYVSQENVKDKDGNLTGETAVKRMSFMKAWMRDPKRAEFRDIVSEPDVNDPTVLNVWPGFAAERMPDIVDAAMVILLVQPLLTHFKWLLHWNEAHVLFVLMWLAYQVQRPGEKTKVALILYGDQGTGKGMLFEWIGRCVFGRALYAQTDNAKTLLGDHAMVLCNKKLCQYDEASLSDTKHVIHRLKNMITSDRLTFNPKHKPEFSLRCMVNYVFTTNNQTSMPIEPTDRRFAAFEVSQAKMQDEAYFNTLAKHLEQPQVARAFFQYLRDHVDLSHVESDLSAHRPLTQYYKDMQEEQLTPLCKWLSILCRGATDGDEGMHKDYQKVQASVMQERYKEWLSRNYPKQMEFFKGPNFGKELKALCCKGLAERPNGSKFTSGGLTYLRSNGFTYYSFDFAELREHLQKYRLLDRSVD